MIHKKIITFLFTAAILASSLRGEESMDKMWGDREVRAGVESTERAALFRDGNYGMFIHWGLYSHLGGKWQGQDFYGIGEWIMRTMKIPVADYMKVAEEFNPVDFDARAIARTARAAGMKYIIITSKHHDGFAMFKSEHPFNIVDATPFGRDPMKELADACREEGLGFGFYYSHNQDWTAPGGSGGPKHYSNWKKASFDDYFRDKCFPQVKEICTNYGPLSFVWFDTPGRIPKKDVMELVELVRKTQPNAMLCSRVGHGMGDYKSLGDMEVPVSKQEGLWETCDTTNDSWSYAWYDQNWKDAKTILHRLVATVGRGGSYLLNVGPDGRGRIPAPAVRYLEEAGQWIAKHPGVVYAAEASPWGMSLPWGDITVQGDRLNLVVFNWPQNRRIYLPGIEAEILSAGLRLDSGELLPLEWTAQGDWIAVDGGVLTAAQTGGLASVIELKLAAAPKVDSTLGVYPNLPARLPVIFAEVENAEKKRIGWMEKFGEWKHVTQASKWGEGASVTWEVNVAQAGDYLAKLRCRGEDRLVWSIESEAGQFLQNQQGATSKYADYEIGVLRFETPGRHRLTVRLVEGDPESSSLEALQLSPLN